MEKHKKKKENKKHLIKSNLSISNIDSDLNELKNQITDILKPLKSKTNTKIQVNQKFIKFDECQISELKPLKFKQKTNNETNFTNLKKPIKRKRTEEGFTVYNEEELNIGKGGNTSKCPFDCY
ncbi:unnamed protein product [Pneumocystis jirovecii]|uniref:Uncharacterized protein n=1 Tax=Pneumocystis jirovecii TaxID=42068 RepID=L0PFN1_PNEJI|nr:unnamed protein product [Pneumocystis jirovecii]